MLSPRKSSPTLLAYRLACILASAVALPNAAHAAPTANDDAYVGFEDSALIAGDGPILSASFDGTQGTPPPTFDGDWDFLDRIENALGDDDTYPTDGTGNDWKDANFDIATSTVGPVEYGPAPLQSGAIMAWPGAPDSLFGIGAAPGGFNLITTYLFRNTMTLTAEQAASASWTANIISDDGSIVYINGAEVLRLNMNPGEYSPAGPVTTNSQTIISAGNGGNTGSEAAYTSFALDLTGVLTAGVNTIAVEVHQNDLGSSDVGFDLSLVPATSSESDGFAYADDVFGSSQPGFASGDLDASAGFNSSGGLHVLVGGGQGSGVVASGGWQRPFTLAQAATVTVSLRYRMLMQSDFESNEYGEIILDVDGSRYGGDMNNSLAHRSSDGNGGAPDIDTGWQTASFDVPLAAGDHSLTLGLLNFGSTVGSEVIDAWFDDVEIAFQGAAGGVGGSVLKNDEGTDLIALLDDGPDHGTLELDPEGTFTYTPEPGFSGSDSFTYHANDGVDNSNIATVTITVQAVNDPPVASDDGTYTTAEDVPLSVTAANGLLENDSDEEDDALVAQLESDAAHGTVTVNADGSFEYTPELNYVGDDSFTYRAGDGADFSEVATVSLTITPQEDPPTAVDDQYRVVENGVLNATLTGGGLVVYAENFDAGSAPGFEGVIDLEPVQGYAGIGPAGNKFGGLLLRNATSLSGQSAQPTELTITGLPPHTSIEIRFLLAIIDSWNGPTGGQSPDFFGVSVDGGTVFLESFDSQTDGSFDPSYVPAQGGLLADRLDLGFGVNVNSFDSAFDMGTDAVLSSIPHSADSVTIAWFASGAGWTGDTESWGIDNVEIAVGNAPISSATPVRAGSVWNYLADGSDQGTAWRSPQFDDSAWAAGPAQLGYGDLDEATVVGFGPDELNKFPTTYFRHKFQVGDAASVTDLTLGLLRDDGAAVYLNGVEIARDNLAANATFDTFSIAPIGAFEETVFIELEVDPALLVDGENTLAVEIHQTDPASSDISFDLYLNARLGASSGDSISVLANDFDPEGMPITASLVSGPSHGTLEFNADGTFTYTPEPNYKGDDAFVYEVTDGVLSSQATANITIIRGPNAIPVAVADAYDAIEDEALVVSAAPGLLINDTDVEDDPLTASIGDNPQNGNVSINPDGSFTYTPNANFNGVDTFTYIAFDTFDNSQPGLVTIRVDPRNDPPVANPESFIIDPGQPLSGNVVSNDTDIDLDSLTAQLEAGPTAGSLDLNADGSFDYTPPAAFAGTVTFSYRAADASATSLPATVTIHVDTVPVVIGDSYTTQEDTPLVRNSLLGVLTNDTDAEGDPLTPVLDTDVSNGTLTLNPDGSLDYSPELNFFGTDSFTYHVNDGLRDSASATVTIEVQAVNDPPAARDDRYFTLIDQLANIPAETGVLANDIDVDSTSLTVILVDDVTAGVLSLQADGAFTYQPGAAFEGTDSFSYRLNDGALDSNTATVSIDVGVSAGSIAISEIMSHPASENDAEEYIELTNIGSSPIGLLGWQFTNGVEFTFPNVSIDPGESIVIAADVAAFEAVYGAIPNLVGGWAGRLSNSGERVQLFDAAGNESDDVEYSDQGEWARRRAQRDGGEDGWIWVASHDGGGDSIQVINPLMPNKTGQNWAAAAPTPGAANSVGSVDIAPLIRKVRHRPAVPRPGEVVTVSAEVKDEQSTGLSATVYYRVSTLNPGAFAAVPMSDEGDDKFSAILPAQPDGAVVEFYVGSSDGINTRTWPPPTDGDGTQGANLLYQVDGESYSGKQPVYRLIMTVAEENAFRPGNYNSNSNAQKNTTFIVRQGTDHEVRYRCGMRIRGAGSRQRLPRNWRVNIPRDEPWNGSTRMNLNTQFSWLQTIGMKLHRASGIAAPDALPVQVRLNGVDHSTDDQNSKLYGSYVHLEPLGTEFADHQYPADPDGNHYKKVRPDQRWAVRSEADFSPNISAYLNDGWSKGTNSSVNDWTDLHRLLNVMNNAAGGSYYDQVAAVVNIDQWTRWFAVMTFLNNNETNLSNGHDDDYSMYRGAIDPRFVLIPHDLDTIFGMGDTGSDPNATIFQASENSFGGNAMSQLVPFFNHPDIVRTYYRHLRDLAGTTFSREEFNELVQHCADGWVPQNVIDAIITFMDQRRASILSQIPSAFSVRSSLNPQNGLPYTNNPLVTGLGGFIDAVNTRRVLVNGRDATLDVKDGTWSSTLSANLTLLPFGSSWKYLDDGSDQGVAWRDVGFDDASWLAGPAQLGYGDGDEATTVGYGPDELAKFPATYFRTTFEVDDASQLGDLTLSLTYDDGAAVYINGAEVVRVNLAANATSSDFAIAPDDQIGSFTVPSSVLVNGINTIAVEVHQVDGLSSDISMDLDLAAAPSGFGITPGVNTVLVQALDENDDVLETETIELWYDTGATSTIAAGTLESDTTLAAADGPFLVDGDLVVPVGVTLTIEAGASVYFQNGARLIVRGRLVARGTETQRIQLTRQPGDASAWGGILFEATLEDNLLEFVEMNFATSGSSSIGVDASKVTIDSMSWGGTAETVLELDHPSVIVRNSGFPSVAGEEAIRGSSLDGGEYFILEGNTFGDALGDNDIVAFSDCRRPGPIFQAYSNTFQGAGDDILALDGADAHIEDNLFMNAHQDQPGDDTSNAIVADDGSELTIVRNVFADVDHALLLKGNSGATFANNTVVDIAISAINFDEPLLAGFVPGEGIAIDGCIFHNVATVFENRFSQGGEPDPVITIDRSILPVALHALGTGNLDSDPRFVDAPGNDFRLAAGSPALGAGPYGLDMGALVPAGASISAEPPTLTSSALASLSIAGPGITHYRYSLDGGGFSTERSVATPLSLVGLADGEHSVAVIGKNSAGVWQGVTTASVSRPWTVNSSLSRIIINEVLALNGGAFEHEGSFPDVVELHNDGSADIDLAGASISDDAATPLKYVFPANTTLPAGGYSLLFANAPDGTSGLHLGFGLDGDGDGVFLYDSGGTLVDSVEFGPQIVGKSIGRAGQSPEWTLNRPTPGSANIAQALGDPATLKINEWLATNEIVFDADFLELYNPDPLPVGLGGLHLSDDPVNSPQRQTIVPHSYVAGGGFVAFAANRDLEFQLSRVTEGILLSDSVGREIDKVFYATQSEDVSEGRAIDGGPAFTTFVLPTPGFSNNTDLSIETRLIESLRITEIMYHQAGGTEYDYIELQNIGQAAINLAGIRFSEGIRFDFPNRILEPGAIVVVVSDRTKFEAEYGAGVADIAGEYAGKLDNGGERLRLELAELGAGILDFRYDDAWYPETDGGGRSLVIVDATAPRRSWDEKASWRASAEIGGSPGSGSLPAPDYATWVTSNFGEPADPQLSAKDADPDDDGISNLLEFLIGLDPLVADPGALPQPQIVDGFLTLRYRRVRVSGGDSLTAEVSGDLLSWSSDPVDVVQTLIDDSNPLFQIWEARDTTSVAVGGERFMRLRVRSGASDTGYDAWVLLNFGAPDGVTTVKHADPDNDGSANLLEFLLGLDPLVPDASELPEPSIEGGFLTLQFRRARDTGDDRLVVEVSGDLASWSRDAADVVETLINDSNPTFQIWQARDTTAIGPGAGRFMRLRAISSE